MAVDVRVQALKSALKSITREELEIYALGHVLAVQLIASQIGGPGVYVPAMGMDEEERTKITDTTERINNMVSDSLSRRN